MHRLSCPSVPSASPLPGSAPTPAATHDILLIEDEPALRELLREFLQRHGYTVAEAAEGNAALHFLSANRVRLIITDIFMPETDGLEVLSALRRQHPHPAIIAMSGYATVDPRLYLKVAEHLGAVRSLMKPFPFTQLLAAVQEAIGWPA